VRQAFHSMPNIEWQYQNGETDAILID
jgi:hypothetical protein